jgi:hypothetical protein
LARKVYSRAGTFLERRLSSTLAICERTGEHAQHSSELKALRETGSSVDYSVSLALWPQALLRAPLRLGRGQEQTLLGGRETFFGSVGAANP